MAAGSDIAFSGDMMEFDTLARDTFIADWIFIEDATNAGLVILEADDIDFSVFSFDLFSDLLDLLHGGIDSII